MLHENYDRIRLLVDSRFTRYRRRAGAENVHMERIEMWHDLLEAALKADKELDIGPDHSGWEEAVLQAVEKRYQAFSS